MLIPLLWRAARLHRSDCPFPRWLVGDLSHSHLSNGGIGEALYTADNQFNLSIALDGRINLLDTPWPQWPVLITVPYPNH